MYVQTFEKWCKDANWAIKVDKVNLPGTAMNPDGSRGDITGLSIGGETMNYTEKERQNVGGVADAA